MPIITPVARGTLRSRISEHLFEAIVRRQFRPGERIIEQSLAKQLGVAKTTLREALQDLEHQGLITKYEHRGSFVTKLSQNDIKDCYDVRLQLEPHAARLAHGRMSKEHFLRLEELLEKTGEAREKRDFAQISFGDAAFHQLIWACSGNKLLEKTLQIVCHPLWAFELIRLFSAPNYDFRLAHKNHLDLLRVLRDGGTKEVERVFRNTLQVFRQRDIQNLQLTDGDSEIPPGRERR